MRDQEVAAVSSPASYTVVYSRARDLYRVSPDDTHAQMWLSVAVFPLPLPAPSSTSSSYLGPVRVVSGWRKSYSLAWSVVLSGAVVTLPADDLLVTDYLSITRDSTHKITIARTLPMALLE
jgi:hypothetical protein